MVLIGECYEIGTGAVSQLRYLRCFLAPLRA
jgi:hypothetical protein